MMGYRTPNIDRLANEGMRFTDSYGEQSCTAGRASFITGQSGFRTGLTKVGIPGAPVGLQAEDPTIAELLKNHGYATGQFGKNHLGDLNKYLPTVHGFDEFFGNLYHLNAEEEPEMPDYPPEKDFPHSASEFGPRGVLHCWATDKDDPTEEPRWGRVGKQTDRRHRPAHQEAHGDLRRRVRRAAKDFIKRQHEAGKPFFCWVNTTHMHLFTHTKPESLGQAGRWQSPYHDTMIDHDKNVGRAAGSARRAGHRRQHLRDVQHRQRAAHEHLARRRHDAVPQREEHQLGGRLPRPAAGALARQDQAGHRLQRDRPAPRLAADIPGDGRRAGRRGEAARSGHQAAGKTFKVHIDGYNLLPYLTGKEKKSPRQGFIYFDDDGDWSALRYDNWKVVFMEQRCRGRCGLGGAVRPAAPPKLFNLRTDPFERADITSNTYYDWFLYHAYIVLRAQAIVAEFLETFKEFPPRQKAARFTIDQAMEKMNEAAGGAH